MYFGPNDPGLKKDSYKDDLKKKPKNLEGRNIRLDGVYVKTKTD